MTLGVNILTYNGATSFIEWTIRSVHDHVSQIVVYDTGSTDNTIKAVKAFPKVKVIGKNLQHLGKVWTNSPLDIALTEALNEMKEATKTDWILKLDDDEVVTEELMEELKHSKAEVPIYSIPFIHFEKDCILDPARHKNFAKTRLFFNAPDIRWNGIYGKETIAVRNKRISSKANQPKFCQKLKNPFLHFGGLRTEKREIHNYNYCPHKDCLIPIPEQYARYVPDKS